VTKNESRPGGTTAVLVLTSHLSLSVGCYGFLSSLSSVPCVPKPSGALWVIELQVRKVARLLSVDQEQYPPASRPVTCVRSPLPPITSITGAGHSLSMSVTQALGADLASSVSVSLPAQTNLSAHTMLGGKKPSGLQRKETFDFLTLDSCELLEIWKIGTWDP
jgi:hypothetical protein